MSGYDWRDQPHDDETNGNVIERRGEQFQPFVSLFVGRH